MGLEHDIVSINTDHVSPGHLRKFYWTITDWFDDHLPPYRWACSVYWYLYHRLHRSHMVDTRLPKGHWIDKVCLMEAAVFQIVEDYVSRDQEDAFSTINFDSDEYHQEVKHKIIKILYLKNIRLPELQKKYDEHLSEHCARFPMRLKTKKDTGHRLLSFDGDPVEHEKSRRESEALERQIEEETQQTLHLAIDVRQYLWS